MGASKHPGRSLSVLVIGAAAVLIAVGLVLVVTPEAQPAILLVGSLAGLALYSAMYAVQRRRHW